LLSKTAAALYSHVDLITQSARQASGVQDAWMRAIAATTALAIRETALVDVWDGEGSGKYREITLVKDS